MIGIEATAESLLNGGEVLVRTARIDGQILPERVRLRLVGISQDHEAHAVIADVPDIEQQVPGQLLLNGEVPTLYVAGAIIGRYVANLCRGCVKGSRAGEAIRKP